MALRAAALLFFCARSVLAGEPLPAIHNRCPSDLKDAAPALHLVGSEPEAIRIFQGADVALGPQRITALERFPRLKARLKGLREYQEALPDLLRTLTPALGQAIRDRANLPGDDAWRTLRQSRRTYRVGFKTDELRVLMQSLGMPDLSEEALELLTSGFKNIASIPQIRIQEIPKQNFSREAIEKAMATLSEVGWEYLRRVVFLYYWYYRPDSDELDFPAVAPDSDVITFLADEITNVRKLFSKDRFNSHEIVSIAGNHFADLVIGTVPSLDEERGNIALFTGRIFLAAWNAPPLWEFRQEQVTFRLLGILGLETKALQHAADSLPRSSAAPRLKVPCSREECLPRKPGTRDERIHTYTPKPKPADPDSDVEISPDRTGVSALAAPRSTSPSDALEAELQTPSRAIFYGRKDRPNIDWDVIQHVKINRAVRDELNASIERYPDRTVRKLGMFLLALDERGTKKFTKEEAAFFGLQPRHGKPGKAYAIGPRLHLRLDDDDRIIGIFVFPED